MDINDDYVERILDADKYKMPEFESDERRFDPYSEIFIDENNKKHRILYYDKYYHLTTKEQSVYKKIVSVEEVKER